MPASTWGDSFVSPCLTTIVLLSSARPSFQTMNAFEAVLRAQRRTGEKKV
jgi:hypothetical protein